MLVLEITHVGVIKANLWEQIFLDTVMGIHETVVLVLLPVFDF
jgi:hypothetical protein